MAQGGKRLLVVGDSPAALQAACAQLAEAGYTIDQVSRGSEARSHVERRGLPHLAVIVLPLPDRDGLPLCQALGEHARLPLIALASPGSAEEAVQALPVVDDYVRLPVTAGELAARIQRVLGRVADFSYTTGPMLQIGAGLTFYPLTGRLVVKGEIRKLGPIESTLLHVLARHRGQIVDFDALSQEIWHTAATQETRNTLRVHLHRLRRKLQRSPAEPPLIITKRGVGYRFVERGE